MAEMEEERAAVLRRARAALSYMDDLLESSVEAEHLIDAYLDTRRALASAFMSIAAATLHGQDAVLEETRVKLGAFLRRRYGARLPASVLAVRSYSKTHGALLGYMLLHVGEPVRGSRLRVLTADQIHTERRVRELRDLGYDIDARRVSGDDQYVLRSADPDLGAAARLQVEHNINQQSDGPERARLIRQMRSHDVEGLGL